MSTTHMQIKDRCIFVTVIVRQKTQPLQINGS
jgi:hypothetical protein